MNEPNGWTEHKNLVLSELERLNKNVEDLSKDVRDLMIATGKSQIKIGVGAALIAVLMSGVMSIGLAFL